MWQLLAQHTKAVSDSVKALLMSIRTKCPGQKECDQAIDTLNDTVNHLDQAILAAMSQSLQPNASSSLQGFQEQMLESVGEIRDNLQPLATAAKGEAEKLGHQVRTRFRTGLPLKGCVFPAQMACFCLFFYHTGGRHG